MIRHWGRYELRVIWNWPTFALLSYQRWRYRPQDDTRAWFLRARVGPFKIEAVKQR